MQYNVETVRTPLGKRNGGLSAMHSIDLLGAVNQNYSHEAE